MAVFDVLEFVDIASFINLKCCVMSKINRFEDL